MQTLFGAVLVFVLNFALSAQSIERKVGHFKKVIASPKINIVMVPGEREAVKIDYANVDASKINVTVRYKTLHIYLDGSRFIEKKRRVKKDGWVAKESVYRDATITAYITYRELDKLIVRGEQEADLQGTIDNKKFKLTAYGESDITLASVHTGKFKVSLFGQHTLTIKAGSVDTQKYKLFGENKIDAQALQSEEIASATYGESKLRFNAKENLRIVTFGESDIRLNGGAEVNRVTFGHTILNR